jgi:hypothetical protein
LAELDHGTLGSEVVLKSMSDSLVDHQTEVLQEKQYLWWEWRQQFADEAPASKMHVWKWLILACEWGYYSKC